MVCLFVFRGVSRDAVRAFYLTRVITKIKRFIIGKWYNPLKRLAAKRKRPNLSIRPYWYNF